MTTEPIKGQGARPKKEKKRKVHPLSRRQLQFGHHNVNSWSGSHFDARPGIHIVPACLTLRFLKFLQRRQKPCPLAPEKRRIASATMGPTTATIALALLLSAAAPSHGAAPSSPYAAVPPAAAGMKSIGVALKQAHLYKGVEKTVFEHNLSATATHGVMTEAWHAGKSSGINPNLRIRYYIDGETVASVDYPLFLAHGTGPAQVAGTNAGDKPPVWPKNETHIGPWGNQLFGRTHDSGWYNVSVQIKCLTSLASTRSDHH
jgi:hypothetical protein